MKQLLKLLVIGVLLPLTVNAVEVYPGFIDRVNGNGWLERTHNQVTYTSHKPGFDQLCEEHQCKKVDSRFVATAWTPNRVTTYKFDLRINRYNQWDGPEWIIIFQDWALIDANDLNGNHPITTLKIKPMSNGRWRLAHFENSWQFEYSTTDPIDPTDPYDYNHGHLPNVEHGSRVFDDDDMHEWHRIEMVIRDGSGITDGSVTFKVDGRIISDVAYQTKNTMNLHQSAFGLYWSKWYNTDYNFCGNWISDELYCKSTSITIRELHIFEEY